MKIFPSDRFNELRGIDRPIHIAIGMFDGLHIGHQAVIQSALRAADLDGGFPACSLSTRIRAIYSGPKAPHPKSIRRGLRGNSST